MKIKSIKKIKRGRVINLTVHKNHTFITKNGIITHNCDNLTRDFQSAFRSFLDEFSQNTRFIFTGNFKDRIIEPLLDRLENYDFEMFNKKEMIKPIFDRLCGILNNENVKYDNKDIALIISTYYPRIRSMVNALQRFSSDGVLKVEQKLLDNLDAFDNIMKVLHPGTYMSLIQNVNKLNNPSSMYSYLYHNASKYFKPEFYPNTVITIAKYQEMDVSVRDKNLNLAACLTELMNFVL